VHGTDAADTMLLAPVNDNCVVISPIFGVISFVPIEKCPTLEFTLIFEFCDIFLSCADTSIFILG
jgi:hypothetical protein